MRKLTLGQMSATLVVVEQALSNMPSDLDGSLRKTLGIVAQKLREGIPYSREAHERNQQRKGRKAKVVQHDSV